MTLSTNAVAPRPHRLWLQRPGPPVPDGDGGYTQTWIDLNPPNPYGAILTATPENREQLVAGGIQTRASHVIRFPFQDKVTTDCRVLFNARTFYVAGVQVTDERDQELVLAVEERPVV